MIQANEVCFFVLDETGEFFTLIVGVYASFFQMAAEKLRCNCAEHDKHENEEDHDVKHDGQWVENGSHKLTHVRDLVDSSKWTQDTDNFDSWNVAGVN